MKILSVTGGATKFIQLAVAMIETARKGYKPTDLVVISASAIAALPFVMGMYDEMIKEGTSLDLSKFFTKSPVNKKGKLSLSAIWRAFVSLLWGNKIYSFGVQDVTGLLTKYITQHVFNLYQYGNYPAIHVITVEYRTGKVVPVNLKNCTYQEMLDAINASSNIPIFTKDLNGFVDGGTFCKGAAGYLIETGYFDAAKIEKIVSIYSWDKAPVKMSDVDYTKDIFANVTNYIECKELSNDWYSLNHERRLAQALKIDRLELFIPNILTNLYEVNNAILIEAKEKTEIYIKQQLNNNGNNSISIISSCIY
jgi:hypothetical protein